MNMFRQFQPVFANQPAVEAPCICWTRMQAEAGQGLNRIIARKEAERRAGAGLFFWGVGNSPAAATQTLARSGVGVRVVFSVMKGRPKLIDAAPEAVVTWTRYLDCRGVERPLPDHVLVTSRRDSAKGPKRVHAALMCFSKEPLQLRSGIGFDHKAYRNVSGAGAPVGASQVTALLKQVRDQEEAAYEVNMQAQLTGSYWVKLTDPVPLPAHVSSSLQAPVKADDWMPLVREARSAARIEGQDHWDLLRTVSA